MDAAGTGGWTPQELAREVPALGHEHPAGGVGVLVDMSTDDFADRFQQ